MFILTALSMILMFLPSGCYPPILRGDEWVIGKLEGFSTRDPHLWKKVTLADVEGQLPVPTYLPSGYAVIEVYESLAPAGPGQREVLLLISDQSLVWPAGWSGEKYQCRLVLDIGWNYPVPPPAGEKVAAVPDGVLVEQGDENIHRILWYKNFGGAPPDYPFSTLRLYSGTRFPKQELIKIAASTPTSVSGR